MHNAEPRIRTKVLMLLLCLLLAAPVLSGNETAPRAAYPLHHTLDFIYQPNDAANPLSDSTPSASFSMIPSAPSRTAAPTPPNARTTG